DRLGRGYGDVRRRDWSRGGEGPHIVTRRRQGGLVTRELIGRQVRRRSGDGGGVRLACGKHCRGREDGRSAADCVAHGACGRDTRQRTSHGEARAAEGGW